MKTQLSFLPALLLAALATPALAADPLAKNARTILAAHQESVVKIEATVETKMDLSQLGAQMAAMPGRNSTRAVEISGSVLDESGLIVTCLSALDGSNRNQVQARGPDGNTIDIDVSTTITEVRIRYADGKKVPGKVIMKDTELDLAFLRPDTAVKPRQFLTQAPPAKAEVFDQLITLTRGGKVTAYEPELGLSRISAILQKPSQRYVTFAHPGTPAFDLDGKLVGLGVARLEPKDKGGAANMSAPPIILPISEVLEVAKQVK